MVKVLKAGLALGLLLGVAACGSDPASDGAEAEQVLNIYTARHYDADQILYDRFTEETGIAIRTIELEPDMMIERIRAEGDASAADVVLMADAGALWRVEDAGLLQPIESTVLSERIPAQYRDDDNHWFGFARRARVIAYDKAEVTPAEVATYEQLADPRFDGEICVRSSDNVYNQSILASFIETWGADQASEWAEAVTDNMARAPQGGDTDQIKAVAAGACEIALVNSYYYLRLANSDDAADRDVANSVAISFPGQDGRGTHVNISGGGVAVNAPNRDNAVRFLEFLTSNEAQRVFAEANNEFPMVAGVETAPTPGVNTDFKADPVPVSIYGQHQAGAQAIFDRVGWR